jgi:hypothetical protein
LDREIPLSDAFGHSGIRVIDRVNDYDIVFNYGVYDYNAPNFYGKFCKRVDLSIVLEEIDLKTFIETM